MFSSWKYWFRGYGDANVKINIQKSLLFYNKLPIGVGVSRSFLLGFTVASTIESIVGSAVSSAFGLAVGSIGSEVTVTQM